jgi:hypothetical protein
MEFSTGVKPILLKSAKDDKYIHIIMPLNKWLLNLLNSPIFATTLIIY